MDILNNREIAITLWLLAIMIFIFSSPKMTEVRRSFGSLLSSFFVKQIMTVLGLMVVYMGFVVYILSEVDLWNVGQIKNTLFWCASVGFMSLFKLESIKKDKSFFKHSVIDNLKLLAIIQFVVGVYTFPLLVEIMLVPILALIGGMLAIAGTDKKHHQVRMLLEYSLSLLGVILIIYTMYMLITNFGEFGKEKTIYDFFVPPLLTLLYLPFIFIMVVYTTYEQVFVRLQFSIKNRTLRYLAKFYAAALFNVRLKVLERWSSQVSRENIQSHSDLIDTFKYIYKVKRAEENPSEVPYKMGWSPYEAKTFLSNEGLETGYYNKLYDGEWFASSPMVEFGDGIIPDNIAYYVEGTEGVANTLKIKLNVNDANGSDTVICSFLELANILSFASINQKLSKKMTEAVLNGEKNSENYGCKEVTVRKEIWSGHKLSGFTTLYHDFLKGQPETYWVIF